MKRLSLPSLAALLFLLSACVIVVDDRGRVTGWHGFRSVEGSGYEASETRTVAAFDEIEFDLGGEVEVRVGEETSLRIITDDNLIEHVTTRVSNGVLRIGADKNCEFRSGLRIEISTPELVSFRVDGSGDVVIHGVHGARFEAVIDGAGEIVADGEVDEVTALIDGAGTIDLIGVSAKEARAEIDGAGNIHVHAREALVYEIDGAGNIRYQGTPNVHGAIDGAGSVRASR